MGELPAAPKEASDPVSFASATARYFRSLWRGERPLARVFWTDMAIVGTLVNVLGSVAAMLLFVSGAPIALGVAAHFAPVPYNILLFLAVWQSAARDGSGWAFPAQVAAMVWLILAIAI